MSVPSSGRTDRPLFRLYHGDEDSDCPGGLSPRMTLTDFFETWFLPIVLIGEREDASSTILLYRDALRYWVEITGDPPLADIDDFTLATFQEGLRKATYRRGKLSMPIPLSKLTIHRHLRNIRTVLHRVGPTIDPNRPGKSLLKEAPHIRLHKPKIKLKPCFSLVVARRIVAAIPLMDRPTRSALKGRSTTVWWLCRIGMYFYTGLRSGTVRRLRRRHMSISEDGHHWLDVPEEAVPKTDKGKHLVLHPLLVAAIEASRRSDDLDELISPSPHCDRYMQTLHDQLQALAGVPAEKRLSPHAWRRTYADQMALRGLDQTIDITRRALDHSEAKTTTDHYVDIENKFRLHLPALWGPDASRPEEPSPQVRQANPNQRWLF